MKVVHWTDDTGRQWRTLEPEGANNPSEGIPDGPPDLRQLDWDEIKTGLHNALSERGLWTWNDVMAQQNALNGAILAVLHHRVVALYKQEALSARPTGGESRRTAGKKTAARPR